MSPSLLGYSLSPLYINPFLREPEICTSVLDAEICTFLDRPCHEWQLEKLEWFHKQDAGLLSHYLIDQRCSFCGIKEKITPFQLFLINFQEEQKPILDFFNRNYPDILCAAAEDATTPEVCPLIHYIALHAHESLVEHLSVELRTIFNKQLHRYSEDSSSDYSNNLFALALQNYDNKAAFSLQEIDSNKRQSYSPATISPPSPQVSTPVQGLFPEPPPSYNIVHRDSQIPHTDSGTYFHKTMDLYSSQPFSYDTGYLGSQVRQTHIDTPPRFVAPPNYAPSYLQHQISPEYFSGSLDYGWRSQQPMVADYIPPPSIVMSYGPQSHVFYNYGLQNSQTQFSYPTAQPQQPSNLNCLYVEMEDPFIKDLNRSDKTRGVKRQRSHKVIQSRQNVQNLNGGSNEALITSSVSFRSSERPSSVTPTSRSTEILTEEVIKASNSKMSHGTKTRAKRLLPACSLDCAYDVFQYIFKNNLSTVFFKRTQRKHLHFFCLLLLDLKTGDEKGRVFEYLEKFNEDELYKILSKRGGSGSEGMFYTFCACIIQPTLKKPHKNDYIFLGMLCQRYPELFVKLWNESIDTLTSPKKLPVENLLYNRFLYLLQRLAIFTSIGKTLCATSDDIKAIGPLTEIEKKWQPDILEEFLKVNNGTFHNILLKSAESVKPVSTTSSSTIVGE